MKTVTNSGHIAVVVYETWVKLSKAGFITLLSRDFGCGYAALGSIVFSWAKSQEAVLGY